MQATERSWQRFISQGPVFDQDRLYAKEWAQWMLAELGAPNVLICLAASSVPEVLVLKMCIPSQLRCACIR